MTDMQDRRDADTDERRDAPDTQPRVAALDDLDDFGVAEGYPDPRGWDVLAAGGTRVGKVKDLIVDTGAMRTRYLVVQLDRDAAGLDDDRDVLVPVGQARLDDDDDRVVLDSLDTRQLATLPPYTRGEITRDYERSLRPGFGAAAGAAAGTAAGADEFYATPDFDDRRFFAGRRRTLEANERDRATSEGRDARDEARVTISEEELEVGKKQVQAGEVGIRKTIETEHVRETVPVMHEEVTIERRPIDANARAGRAEIGEDEVRIPVMREELVTEKRPVAKEEVVIRTRAVEETKTVEADLRKERIDIDDQARATNAEGAPPRRDEDNPPPR